MTTAELLFACLRFSVFGTELTEEEKTAFSAQSLKVLYHLSAHHDLAHLVCHALEKNGLLPEDDIGQALRKQKNLAIYRCLQQDNAYGDICRTLEETGISYVPLKGAVIRKLYPEPWMRTSCDIDILIRQEELKRAVSILMGKLGYVQNGHENYHDISLYSPEGVNLELHFYIREAAPALDSVLDRVWDYVKPGVEEPLCCRMTDEFFMFHQFAHMSYHFMTGGCGLRPFLDCRLLADKLNLNQQRLNGLLEQGGIRPFAKTVSALSGRWFGGENEAAPGEEQIMNYILRGGVYGSKENHIRSQQVRRGGAEKNVLHRIWLPYNTLKNYYKSLEGRKYLLPVYEARRWIRIVFKEKKGRASVHELRKNLTVSNQDRDEMREIFDRLGLTEQYHDA